jgi:starch phosphorylase
MFKELVKLDGTEERCQKDITEDVFFGFPLDPIVTAENKLCAKDQPSIAYFSMEYGLAPSIYHTFKTENPIKQCNILSEHEVFSNMKDMDYYHNLPVKKILDLPIYSGGLGVLAGDTLKSAADLNVPLVGIGILWNKGYFRQKFWFKSGGQVPEELSWDPHSYPGLIPLIPRIKMNLSGATLELKLWKYYVYSNDLKYVIPLVLLDSNVPENPEYLRDLTNQLYRSENSWIKIAQRMILGIGGIKALDALGYNITKYHLNEGHAAFAFVEKARTEPPDTLKHKFAYTCHTPVEAGHDRFPLPELGAALGPEGTEIAKNWGHDDKHPGVVNLTLLAMNSSDHVNGVAKKHGEVMRLQFPQYKDRIKSITNGIHTHTWLSEPIQALLKKYSALIGNWEGNPVLLSHVVSLKTDENFRKDLWEAHVANKKRLADLLTHWFFNDQAFTICWARRFAPYKRPTMLLHDPNRLLAIAKKYGPLQVVIAGKAHPADAPAAEMMEEMMSKISQLNGERKLLRICFIENYDTYFAKILTTCTDVWLNNPLPPFEASGTSGMKAILNGVLQLSTLDGWIVEAADMGIGKIFGYVPPPDYIGSEADNKMDEDAEALYQSLEELVPLYYSTAQGNLTPSKWIDMMINCIAASSFFNTHRMVSEYRQDIWGI